MRLRNILDALHQIGWVIVGTRPVRVPAILIVFKIIHVLKVAFLWSAPRLGAGTDRAFCVLLVTCYTSRYYRLVPFIWDILFQAVCLKRIAPRNWKRAASGGSFSHLETALEVGLGSWPQARMGSENPEVQCTEVWICSRWCFCGCDSGGTQGIFSTAGVGKTLTKLLLRSSH